MNFRQETKMDRERRRRGGISIYLYVVGVLQINKLPAQAVVGVTGAVGQNSSPSRSTTPSPPAPSKKTATTTSRSCESFHGVDNALFSLWGSISMKFWPISMECVSVVMDNRLVFWMDHRNGFCTQSSKNGDSLDNSG